MTDTTVSAPASGSRLGAGAAMPRAGSRGSGSGAAPLVNNHYKLLQVVLFWAGAVLLPLGLVVIVLGCTTTGIIGTNNVLWKEALGQLASVLDAGLRVAHLLLDLLRRFLRRLHHFFHRLHGIRLSC